MTRDDERARQHELDEQWQQVVDARADRLADFAPAADSRRVDILVDGEPLTREALVRRFGGMLPASAPCFDVAQGLEPGFAGLLAAWLSRFGVKHEYVARG